MAISSASASALSDAPFAGAPQSAPEAGSRWALREQNPAAAARLAGELNTHPLVARILAARGLTNPGEAERFLNPSLARNLNDPAQLLGMEPAVARLGAALEAGERITIFGDYDVDGVTGTSILMQTLRELGCAEDRLDYYIPRRLSEGYGLSVEALEEIHHRGAQLVVTVDCGVTAIEPAARARELGMDLIITDHHTPAPELPQCVALINPKQPGCPYPFKELAGAGVAFKLAHALLKARHADAARAKEFLKSLLDLAALGTVADVVPLLGENRALVKAGLGLLRETQRPGLRALYERCGLDCATLDCGHIGFVIGPRLNAAGRTDHAMYGVELLLTGDRREAQGLAEKLEGFNLERRAIETAILKEAAAQLAEDTDREGAAAPPRVIVVAGADWHHGVLGIVASRLLSRHYRPTIVISVGEDGTAKGSGRSIPGFDLHEALCHCGGCLTQFGGHTMAAGLTLPVGGIPAFREAINAYAEGLLADGALAAEAFTPMHVIDATAAAADLTEDAVRQLAALAPFGQECPKPLLAFEGLTLVDEPRILKERHMKLRLAADGGRQTVTALAWGMAGRYGELMNSRGRISLCGSPVINAWNGRVSVEIEVKDFRLG